MKPVRTRRGALPQSGPLPLSHVLHTPPAEPRRVDDGRNTAILTAIAALAAVLVLVIGAIGLPLVIRGLSAKGAPAPRGSFSTELALPATIATPDPTSSDSGQSPTDQPPVDATPGDTAGAGNSDPAWWSSIVISWQDRVQAGGSGWVEVTTRGATQCELTIYYSATSQNIGTFGTPSNKTRRRTYSVGDQMTGTARPRVSCWRDGPRTGPSHTWSLTVPIDPAAATTPPAAPSPTPKPTAKPTPKPSTKATATPTATAMPKRKSTPSPDGTTKP